MCCSSSKQCSQLSPKHAAHPLQAILSTGGADVLSPSSLEGPELVHEALKWVRAFPVPLLTLVAPASVFLSVSPHFSFFSPVPKTNTSSAPGTIFLSTAQSDKLKIFLSRKTQTYHLICLFFRKKQSFQNGWRILFDLQAKNACSFQAFFVFLFFWKEVFQINNVTAKWETEIVHLLQIISPFLPPQKQVWRTKSINPPHTVLRKTKHHSCWHFSAFLHFLFFPTLFCPSSNVTTVAWASSKRDTYAQRSSANCCGTSCSWIFCSHRTPKVIVFSLKYMNIWYPPFLPFALIIRLFWNTSLHAVFK